MSPRDDNDRLRDGTLPSDPCADAVPFEEGGSSGPNSDSVHSVHSVHGEDWEQPLPIAADQPDLPDFPLDVLPLVLRDFVEATAEAAQVPPEMAACCVIGVVSSAIARTHVIEPWDGYFEPVNIWLAPTAAPGARKSTVIRAATAPVARTEARLAAESATHRAKLEARAKVMKKRVDAVTK
jgi:hypothetical protein